MAITYTKQTIIDGTKRTIVKITLESSAAADDTKAILFNASDYTPAVTSNALESITYELNGFSADLYWDADTDIPLISLEQDHAEHLCFEKFGGLVNNSAAANRTGDILITTHGTAANDMGYIILTIRKKS